jgi:hypothetical protein
VRLTRKQTEHGQSQACRGFSNMGCMFLSQHDRPVDSRFRISEFEFSQFSIQRLLLCHCHGGCLTEREKLRLLETFRRIR